MERDYRCACHQTSRMRCVEITHNFDRCTTVCHGRWTLWLRLDGMDVALPPHARLRPVVHVVGACALRDVKHVVAQLRTAHPDHSTDCLRC